MPLMCFLHYLITMYLVKIQQKVHMSMREKTGVWLRPEACVMLHLCLLEQLPCAYPRGQQQSQMMTAEWMALC